MTLPTSPISRSTKTHSLATRSFKARTSCMAPLERWKKGGNEKREMKKGGTVAGRGVLPPLARSRHVRRGAPAGGWTDEPDGTFPSRHQPAKNQPPRRQGRQDF